MGGRSYTSLLLAQLPENFFDYFLYITNPNDVFTEEVSFSPTRLLELMFQSNSTKHFGFSTILNSSDYSFLNQRLLKTYISNSVSRTQDNTLDFNFLERINFYSAMPYYKFTHELENLELFDTSINTYENFINI